MRTKNEVVMVVVVIALAGCSGAVGADDAGGAGGAGGSAAGGSAAGGSTAGGATAGGSTAGGSTAGGSTAGGATAGGSRAGGSTAGGSTAGGSTAGGSTAGGSTAGGSTAGGSTAGGSTAGGSTAGGSTSGGSPLPTDGGVLFDDEPPTNCAATPCRYITPAGSGTRSGLDWANALPGVPLNGNGYSTTLLRGATYFFASGQYGNGSTIVFIEPPTASNATITLKKAIDAQRCAAIGRLPADCRGTDVGWSESMGQGESIFTGPIAFARSDYVLNGQVRDELVWNRPNSYGFRVCGAILSSDALNGPNDYARRLRIKFVDIGGPYGTTYSGTNQQRDGVRLTAPAAQPIGPVSISRCFLHNLGVPIYGAGTDGIIVERNYIGPSFQKEAIIGHLPSSNWVIRNNRFIDSCQGIPGQADAESCTAVIASWANGTTSTTQSDNWTIHGNVIARTSAGRMVSHSDGLIVGGAPNAGSSKARNWKVYNNVIANSGTTVGNYTMSLHGTGHQTANNLFFNLTGGALGCSVDANCSRSWCSRSTCGNLDRPSGMEDPFVDAAMLDFRLTPTATARNAGVTLMGVDAVDPNGTVRGADGLWDIGAFERP